MERAGVISGHRVRNALLAAAAVLVAAMAWTTPTGVHPDENPCLAAVRYHETRWMPADIRDPAAAPSFSGYGVSRLAQRTVYWNLAGKVSRIARAALPGWRTPERAFNVALFALLVAFCFRRSRSNPWIFLPVGLAPQVWYLFSYCTSDAWDVFLSVLAFHETAFSGSLFWRSVLGGDGVPPRRRACGLVLAGCAFGLLPLGKPTVLASLLVAAVVVARRLADLPAGTVRRALPALAAVALVAAAWSAASFASERARYGARHAEIRAEMAALRRAPDFVPDERGVVRHFSVDLRRRGVSLLDVLVRQKPPFLPTTLASFAGSYGSMTFPSPRPWYAAVAVCWLALATGGAVRFVRSRPRAPDVLAAAALLAVPAMLLAASAWHSWTADYQPQGRYLFPSNVAWAAFGALVPAPLADDRRTRFSAAVFALLLALGLGSLLFCGLIPMTASAPAAAPAGAEVPLPAF